MSPPGAAARGRRLRALHPIAGRGGRCELVYDLERTAVVEVPEALRPLLREALGSGQWNGELEPWLEDEGLLTGQAPERVGPAPDPPPAGITDLSLDLSGACNLACGYCFEDDLGSRVGPMSAETAKAAVDFAFRKAAGARAVTLHFGSGEPLLRFGTLRQVVAEANRRAAANGQRIGYELTTNGTRVTPEIAAFLASEPFRVQLSCDGPPEVHDRNRPFRCGGGSYGAVRRGLELLLAAMPERVAVNAVLTGGTRLATLWSWARELGLRQLNVIKVGSPDDGLVRLHRHELRDYRRDLESLCDDLCRDLEAGRRPIVFPPLTKHVLRLMKGAPRTRYCGVAGSYLGVASDGRVYPCLRHLGLDRCELGDVGGGIDDGERRRFRAELAADVDHRPGCRDCWARYLCGGGCYADSTLYGAEPSRPQSQHCAFWRAEVETAIRLYHRLRTANPLHLLALFGRDPQEVLSGMGLA